MGVITLTPHPAQAKVLCDNRDIVPIVAGRGFGKSYLHRIRALMWSLCFDDIMARRGQAGYQIDPFSPVVSALIMPTQKQVRAIHWIALVNTLEGHPLVKKINRAEMRISFYGNRPDIVCLGANDRNGDGLRGFNFVNLQLDEYQDFRPSTFELVLLPAMSRVPGHQCLVTGTPKGKLNLFYHFCKTYGYHHFVTLDNPTIDPVKVADAQATLPEAMYRQEYLAAWEDFSGKFYSELGEHNRANWDGQRFNLKVLGVDHGDVHPAHIVIGRDDDNNWWYIDGWSPNTGQPITEPEQDMNLVYLAKRYNVDMCLCDPSRPSRIITIRALGTQHNLKGLRKARSGFNKVMEGIAEVHSLVHQKRFWIPNKQLPIVDTVGGVPASMHKKYSIPPSVFYNMMMSYHRATDRNGIILDKVQDGQNDHILDGLRYALATGKPLLT